jgi:hypothetical protein
VVRENGDATLLADLRARRVARRAIEAQDRLELAMHGRAACGDAVVAALSLERDRAMGRLARAAEHLPLSAPLRWCIDEACCAHRALVCCRAGSERLRPCAERLAATLAALEGAMRAAAPPGGWSKPRVRHDACTDPDDRRSR